MSTDMMQTRDALAAEPSPAPSGLFFKLHPFIEAHPEAVFIKKTGVECKTDSKAKLQEGVRLAADIFAFGTDSGIPLTHRIAIKPNLTNTRRKGNTTNAMGIITDLHFMEGLIEGMKAQGFASDKICVREGNWLANGVCGKDVPYTGYLEMGQRTGVHMLDFPTGRRITDLNTDELLEGKEVVWKECPDGVVFRRIGCVDPFNQPDAWLLNVAKLKAHGMGMTLSVKNIQGICVSPHIFFCEGVRSKSNPDGPLMQDFQPDVEQHVADLHAQHLRAGYPRWDRPGRAFPSGYAMEMWCQRICDLHSVTKVDFSIIEGIYGRNGNGFLLGPGPEGLAEDFMANVLIFGKNPFRVDIIGTWLAGHEPRNFGLFHIARERGLSTAVEPAEVPVYLWQDPKPQQISLADLERIPLVTNYLQRDYDGQQEPLYHLVNE